MSKNTYKIEYEQFEQIYETMGSKNLQTQSELIRDFTSKQKELYFNTIDYIYKMITVIGIFAGFGFTAFGFITNFTLFVLGEIILIGIVLVGLYYIPKIYITEYNAIVTTLSKYQSEIFKPRNDILSDLVNNFINNKEVDADAIDSLREYDSKLLGLLSSTSNIDKSPFEKPINRALILCLLGIVLLLSSFIPCDYLK